MYSSGNTNLQLKLPSPFNDLKHTNSKVIQVMYTDNSLKSTLANIEHPDEKLHNMAFHQGLHLPRLIILNQLEEFIAYNGLR